ncbi:MAG: PAS domain S-box protein, partial [Desulfobacterales bacterium]|nr:PAS domain S-box protein [Desulfobacterales bacterium]
MANKPTYEELEQKVKAFERAESEHNQVEEKLWESEERHRLFVETMNEGMAIQRDQLLTYVNKAFCRMLGYSRDELIGKEIATLFDQENRKKLKNQMAKRREGVAEPYEITLTAKDGSQIYTIITPHSLYYEDNIFHGSSAIFTDITKRKQAEVALQKAYDELEVRIMERTAELQKTHDELEQRVDERTRELKKANDKLEKANEETKTFAYIVSHDLKAPLLNIKGFSNELNRAINEINS